MHSQCYKGSNINPAARFQQSLSAYNFGLNKYSSCSCLASCSQSLWQRGVRNGYPPCEPSNEDLPSGE
eukprot:4994136-Amphidinium_carterae.1